MQRRVGTLRAAMVCYTNASSISINYLPSRNASSGVLLHHAAVGATVFLIKSRGEIFEPQPAGGIRAILRGEFNRMPYLEV